MKRTFEERLNIVSLVKIGKPVHQLSHEHMIKEYTILEWIRKYDLYGEASLKKHPNIRASGGIKEE